MKHAILRVATLVAFGVAGSAIPTTKAQAQGYQVDCAILLCLAGGWPSSVPCTHARAEFIRRITPWPIEPPLQIWRCPLGVADEGNIARPGLDPLYDAAYSTIGPAEGDSWVPLLYPAQAIERSDIDISGSGFDFVRSIRVFHVEFSQYEGRSNCLHSDVTRYGSYDLQGDFAWERSSARRVPAASRLRIPSSCDSYEYRSVFVDWRDHAGNYGFEEVQY